MSKIVLANQKLTIWWIIKSINCNSGK